MYHITSTTQHIILCKDQGLPAIRYLAAIFFFSHNRVCPRDDVSHCNLDIPPHKFPVRYLYIIVRILSLSKDTFSANS